MRILVIEDDERTAAYLVRALRENGRVADHAADGATGLAMARERIYDAIVLDRLLPGLDGLSVVRGLRADGNPVPVLMLSAHGSVQHRVEGFRAGCDDYMSKPYAFVEVTARLDRILARSAPEIAGGALRIADLELDATRHAATRAGQALALTAREFLLLECLMRHAGEVVPRALLLESAWEYDFEPPDRLIDHHMRRLRGKVDEPFAAPLIEVVRGVGYRLAGEPPDKQ
ncbi:winged helix-turn-helix domain-containing protein [Achromobacter aloeverae]